MALTLVGIFLKIDFLGIEVGTSATGFRPSFSLKERTQTLGCLGLVLPQSRRVTLQRVFRFSKLLPLNWKKWPEHLLECILRIMGLVREGSLLLGGLLASSPLHLPHLPF